MLRVYVCMCVLHNRLITSFTGCHLLMILIPADNLRLKVVTIATNETDGYKRFMRSAKNFDLDVEVGGEE